jgi:hypothetical protein
MNEGQGEDHATAARNEEKGDIANVLEDRAAKEGIDNAVHADAGKGMSTVPSASLPCLGSVTGEHANFR